MTFKEKCKLVQIHGAISDAIGEEDPDLQGMTTKEIRLEEPLMWAAMRIAKLIGPCPWNKYLESNAGIERPMKPQEGR